MKNFKFKFLSFIVLAIVLIGISKTTYAANEMQYGTVIIRIIEEKLYSSIEVEKDLGEYGSEYIHQPQFREEGVGGILLEVYADEDIYTAESQMIFLEGELVTTVVTDSDGTAYIDNLPFGRYFVKESKPPEGYSITDDSIHFVVDNTKILHIEKKHMFNTTTSDVIFEYGTPHSSYIGSVYGIYLKDNLYSSNGTAVLFKDDLIDAFAFDDNQTYVSTLPVGSYYIKQLYAPYPYELNIDTITINIEKANIRLLCNLTSPNIMYNTLDIVPYQYYNDEDKAKKIAAFKEMSISRIIDYNYTQGNYIPEITYNLYEDIDHTRLVKSFTTNEYGFAECKDILAGKYYTTIEFTDERYIYDDLGEIEVVNDKDWANVICHGFKEDIYLPGPPLIGINFYYDDGTIKTEYAQNIIATENGGNIGAVPNMKYMITDSNNNIIIRSMTDDNGSAWIPSELFEDNITYYFTVIDSPIDLNVPAKTAFLYKEGLDINVPIKVNPRYGLKGDLDFNGVIDANDASIVLEVYKNENWTSADLPIADMDNNKLIDANDASLILEYYKTHQ